MGCFLACFGSSKDGKRRKPRHKVLPRDQRNTSSKPVQPGVSLILEDYTKNLLGPVSEVQDKPEEQLNLSTKKKVTFDSNVKTYEHVCSEEVTDFPQGSVEGKKKEEDSVKSSHSKSSEEDSSVTSTGSYPPNHRYQNCRDSDDEYEELDYDGSDLSDEDDEDDEEDLGGEYAEIYDGMVDLRTRVAAAQTEEVESSNLICGLSDGEVKPNPNARDRSVYVHSVLNPVENLTQWKAVKARGSRGTPPLRPQKENFVSNQESPVLFSSESGVKELPFSFKSKSNQPKKLNHEIAVDASLSNWLVSSAATPVNKTNSVALDAGTPERSMSQGSNSVISHDDRPILGALTVEEIKQFSATSSPRKSPSRSPDEMPIIGTVGTYWNHTGTANDSGSASSFKGIPNTTSKYREDKRVNWHSTPFETRLERALNGDAVEDYSTHVPRVR
ncbi:Protein JASON [Quillaja saponaria]|uniref:Protein JASON n=1 Tax=Quillaja saponaria TaxID=32244 RepID=A0AAD7VEI2_QUISA|nr:Protein JASON [Quillaja saponaria]